MKKLIPIILSAYLAGCAGLTSILPNGTIEVGAAVTCGGLTAAVAPEPTTVAAAAAACGGAAIVLTPDKATIDQVETPVQAATYVLTDFLHWIIGGGVLLFIVAWILPGPQTIFGRKIG